MKGTISTAAAVALLCTGAKAQEAYIDTRGVADPNAFRPATAAAMFEMIETNPAFRQSLGIAQGIPPADDCVEEAVPATPAAAPMPTLNLRFGLRGGGGGGDRDRGGSDRERRPHDVDRPKTERPGSSFGLDLAIPIGAPATGPSPDPECPDPPVRPAPSQIAPSMTPPSTPGTVVDVEVAPVPVTGGKVIDRVPATEEEEEPTDIPSVQRSIIGPNTVPSGPIYRPPPALAFGPSGGSPAVQPVALEGGALAPPFVCDDGSGRDLDAHACAYYSVLFTDGRDNDYQFCTGVVVSPRHVLTARHCFDGLVGPSHAPGGASPLQAGQRIALHHGQTFATYWRQSGGALARETLIAIGRGVDLAPAWFSFHPTRDLVILALPDGQLERGARRIATLAGDTTPRWIAPVGLPAWNEVAALLAGAPSQALWTRTAFSIVGAIEQDGHSVKGYGRTTLTAVGPQVAFVRHKDLWVCDGTSGAGMFRRVTSPRFERARHAVVGIVSGAGQATRCTERELYDARTIVRLDGDVPDWIARVTGAGSVRIVSEREGTLLSRDPDGVMVAGLP